MRAHECAGGGEGRPGAGPGMADAGMLGLGASRSALGAGPAPRHFSEAQDMGVHRRTLTQQGLAACSDLMPARGPHPQYGGSRNGGK